MALSPVDLTCTVISMKCSLPYNNLGHRALRLSPPKCKIECIQQPCASDQKPSKILRRSANYQTPIWDYNFLMSLEGGDNKGAAACESGRRVIEELKQQIKCMLDDGTRTSSSDELAKLELVSDIERLGLGYHFEKEINKIICVVMGHRNKHEIANESLHATALRFRIFRQHGFKVSQDVFKRFQDANGNFMACIKDDVKGMLSLYDASFLGVEGENILDRAKTFTIRHLKGGSGSANDSCMAKLVSHALELPQHWRMQRYEARWYIDIYEEREDMVPSLFELAKLDFNIVQVVHQKDLADLVRWWKDLGLTEDMEFARDRLMESFLWGMGMAFQPEFSFSRKVVAKVIALISIIDDVYDFYGSMEELEPFTKSIERWEIGCLDDDQLPYYMKLCFLSLYNTVNELAYINLKENRFNSLPYYKQAWADLCNSYLKEAKLYHDGHTQTLEEYLSNAWKSIASNVIAIHVYLSLAENFTKEALACLALDPKLVQWSGMIVRFNNDLATSKAELARGDVSKSVQCYATESGVYEESAREHVWNLIDENWKKINEDLLQNAYLPQRSVSLAINLVRAAHFMYEIGDGHGSPTAEDKDRIISLLVDPIPVSM